MGMTIEQAIEIINHYSDYTKDKVRTARLLAINTMRKYQQIVDIVSLNDEEFKQCGLRELKEILEVIADD